MQCFWVRTSHSGSSVGYDTAVLGSTLHWMHFNLSAVDDYKMYTSYVLFIWCSNLLTIHDIHHVHEIMELHLNLTAHGLWYGLCSLYRCILPINKRPQLFYEYKKDGINTINTDDWFVLFTEQLKLSLEMSRFI